ncbi:DUF308 domain-containing protein [uncultured Methanoregula sp.]|uniref:HdeD family acid-resistance protein n=1 Tax=uncultured Methanoregula sp. TaxID=1005933 RepID=UPI002AAB311A|nr:DUF308 domain-containing protein [uncultured Methanoregula sp.]
MSIVAGIAAIILGIMALIFPMLAFSVIEYIFAIYAVVMSASLVITGAGLQKKNRTHGLLLVIAGIIGILIGISVLVAPRVMAITAMDLIGIWAIVAGVSDLIFVFTSASGPERTIKTATGILTFAAGVFILAAPKTVDGFVLVTFVGIFVIIAGILTILFGTAKPPEKRPVNHLIYK